MTSRRQNVVTQLKRCEKAAAAMQATREMMILRAKELVALAGLNIQVETYEDARHVVEIAKQILENKNAFIT